MSQSSDPIKVQMFSRAASDASAARPSEDAPFKLLVVADFSGRASRGICEPLAGRRPKKVDRDDLDDVLAKLGPELDLATRAEGERRRLTVRSLDDLHPDTLWESLDVFGDLRSLRRRLSNPDTFATAAAEVRGAAPVPSSAPEEPAAATPEPTPIPGGGSLLDATLAETDAAISAGTGSTLVDAILRDLVIPRVPATPGQDDLIAGVDDAAAEEMRALLGTPELRRLESAWRAMELLVRRLETDSKLQVWIFDATPEELVRDVVPHEDPRTSGLWRALFEPDAADGAPRWAMWTSLDLTFGGSPKQAALLSRFARVAAAATAPFVAAAREDLAGCASLAASADPDDWSTPAPDSKKAWDALRGLIDSSWVLLALPRMLLRAPYGKKTSPLERFHFEELSNPPLHEEFLWGSGAIAPTIALAEAYTQDGWGLSPEGQWEIDRLPLPVYDEHGETDVKPCAEVVLSERASNTLRTSGVVPLATVRGTDKVRFGPLMSLAGTPIAGRWYA